MKTLKEVYNELLELSQMPVKDCYKDRDKQKQLAGKILKIMKEIKDNITDEELCGYVKFPILHYHMLIQNITKDRSLARSQKDELIKNFKSYGLNVKSLSAARRLDIQLKNKD